MPLFIKSLSVKVFVSMLILTFFNSVLMAQEGSSSSTHVTKTTSTTQTTWYAQPWVWVVGAAVFILLLVALLRSNSKSTNS